MIHSVAYGTLSLLGSFDDFGSLQPSDSLGSGGLS